MDTFLTYLATAATWAADHWLLLTCWIVFQIVAGMLGLWIMYLAATHLDKGRVAGQLTGVNRILAGVVLALATAVDVWVQFNGAMFLFLDPPRWGEFLVTQRLKRYLRTGGWRGRWALHLGTRYLNWYDRTGNHLD